MADDDVDESSWEDQDPAPAGGRDQYDETGAPVRDSDSMQSPDRELVAQTNPVGDAESAARAARTAADAGQSQVAYASQQTAPAPATASPGAGSPSSTAAPGSDGANGTNGTNGAPTPGDDTATAPRPRVRQIGQLQPIAPITPLAPPTILHQRAADPEAEAQAQAQDQARANQMVAQDLQSQQDAQAAQIQAQQAQIAQINGSDPYQGDDGRWKKQLVDPDTGAINEHDVIDNGWATIDRGTGDILLPTSQGPRVIGQDARTAQTIGLVNQRAALAAQGSRAQAAITQAQQALAANTQALGQYGGVPQRLEADVAKYAAGIDPQADPNDPATQGARANLAAAQANLAAWTAQHPEYTGLKSRQQTLQQDLQEKQQGYDATRAAIAQNLTDPGYARQMGTLPANGSVPAEGANDLSLPALQARAAEIAAQSHLPPGVATAAALVEAKKNALDTVGGTPIEDALKNLDLAPLLPQLTPPQLRAAVQAGVISRGQMHQVIIAQSGAKLAPGSPGSGAADNATPAPQDNGVGAVQDFAARVVGKFSSVLNRAGEGLAQWASKLPGQAASTADAAPTFDKLDTAGDLAKWFHNNAQVAEGGAGYTNPAMNDSTHATVANAIGFMGALAAVSTAAEPLMPEVAAAGLGELGGLSVAGRVMGFLGRLYSPAQLARLAPGLAVVMPMASSEAYDAAKAQGLSDVEATQRGMIEAGKQAVGFLVFHGLSGGAGAAVKAALPGVEAALPAVVRPLARAGAEYVGGAAANVAGSALTNLGENLLRAPGTEARPILDKNDLVSALTFAAPGAIAAGVHAAGMPAMISKAQDTVSGGDPTIQALQRAARDPQTNPALRDQYNAKIGALQAQAAQFLKDNGAPQIAPGAKNDPLAQKIVDLNSQAADLRAKIQGVHDTGGPTAANDLATHQQALADTEGQLHQASLEMQARIPDGLQDRIYRAVAPGVDREAAQAKAAESPTAHFAQQELGDGMRDQYLAPEKQRQIRQLARAKGVSPEAADMIVNQALGARATGELRQALTGGKLDPGKAAILKAMGFLADGPPTPEALARRGQDGQPNVTDDAQHLFPPGVQRAVALKPGALRFAPTPEDGAVPPGKILYQNAVNGAQRVADAARRMIPETLHARNDGVAAETQAMKPPPARESGARISPAEIAVRNARAEAYRQAIPDVVADANTQAKAFVNRFGRVFGDVTNSPDSANSGGAYYHPQTGLHISDADLHISAGAAYENAIEGGATPEQAREAAKGKIRAVLDEELRHAADVRANGDEATAKLWNSLPKAIQDATRRIYSRDNPHSPAVSGLSPTQLGYEFKRILSQQGGTGEVSELMAVTRQAAEVTPPGKFGWVAAIREHLAKLVNFLKSNGGSETAKQLAKLQAQFDEMVKNAAPAEGETPTAVREPAPSREPVLASSLAPTPAERTRDEIASGLAEAPKMALASHLFGAPHEETTARLGMSPEAPAQLRARAIAPVGREMQARGVSPEGAAQALRPGVLGPDGPLGFAARSRDGILSQLASPYREVLSAHLAGETSDQIGARMGADPAHVSRATDRASAHVAGILQRQGIAPEDARAVLVPRKPGAGLYSSPEGQHGGDDRAEWINREAKARGFSGAEDMSAKDPAQFRKMASQWGGYGRDEAGTGLANQRLNAINNELYGHRQTAADQDENPHAGGRLAGTKNALGDAIAHTGGNAGATSSLDGGAEPGGAERWQQRNAHVKWARENGLLLARLPERLAGSRDNTGQSEHDVFPAQGGGRWIKITKPGSGDTFGLAPKPVFDGHQLVPASPLEYLQRLQNSNALFGDDIRLHGIVDDGRGVRIVTSQPDVAGSRADEQQIRAAMKARGFTKIGQGAFYRPSDNIAVFDLHFGNAVIRDGVLLPFDAIVVHPAGALAHLVDDARMEVPAATPQAEKYPGEPLASSPEGERDVKNAYDQTFEVGSARVDHMEPDLAQGVRLKPGAEANAERDAADGPLGVAARTRDDILSRLASPHREVLSAHLAGETSEQIGARMGADPANVSRAADRASAHVAGIMEKQGVHPDDARAALTPRQWLASSPEPGPNQEGSTPEGQKSDKMPSLRPAQPSKIKTWPFDLPNVTKQSALGAGAEPQTGRGANLAIRPQTAKALREKFAIRGLNAILRSHGIARTADHLTNGQGRYLLTFKSLDAVRDCLAEATAPRATFGHATSRNYRRTFIAAHPRLEGRVWVHHAVEQNTLKRFPRVVSESEIHSLENLRGIPNHLNPEIHLRQIRKSWDRFYQLNPNPTKEQLLQHATMIDNQFGHRFLPRVR